MKGIYDKKWLLDTLQKNRASHREIFLKAVDGFKKVALARFEKNIERLKKGKMPEHYISFTQPVDQTKDYDRAIAMLKTAEGTTVELNEKDYSQYVLDNWEWKNNFIASNSTYTSIEGAEGIEE